MRAAAGLPAAPAPVAQRTEQEPSKLLVEGSNPSGGAAKLRLRDPPRWADRLSPPVLWCSVCRIRCRPHEDVSRACARVGATSVVGQPVPAGIPRRRGRQVDRLLDRARRGGRVPGPERCRQDDNAQDVDRVAATDERPWRGARLRSFQAGQRDARPPGPHHGQPQQPQLGSPGCRLVRAATGHLRDPARRVPTAIRSIRRAARPERADHEAGAQPLARRADEDGDRRRVCCTIPRSCSSTSQRSGSTSTCSSGSARSSPITAGETGATVLLTSHYMADIVALCERVIVIHQGIDHLRRCPGRVGRAVCRATRRSR